MLKHLYPRKARFPAIGNATQRNAKQSKASSLRNLLKIA